MAKRMAPAERKQQLLAAGYDMANTKGLGAVNRVQLGKACGVTDGLVSRYFGNADGMYAAILGEAIARKDAAVVADALEMGISVEHVPPKLLNQARQEVAKRTEAP